MKTWFLILLCTLGLAGCSSEYLIATTDGQFITSDEKPRLDKNTGMIEFEDHECRE